ncbi:MAG: response regulator [Campylobacterota bacterium]|nr:response regulator [Campylobacterota bacterium]
MNNKKTILIVDDTPINIAALTNILKNDYKVIAATSGGNALKISLKEPRADLILLDIMMPDIDGYEVCRQLKKEPLTANIPIIFITALNDKENEEKGFLLGGVDYITKPINPSIVKARVATHLALYEQKQILEMRVQEEIKKRLEQEKLLLRQSRLAAMGEMMSAITHQWNQPLNAIGAITTSLNFSTQLETSEDDELLKQLEQIDKIIAFMSGTMNDFKNYFKPNKNKEMFGVKNEVESVVSILSSILKVSNITLDMKVDDNVTGFGVASEFNQVLLNIISNAKDAIKAKMKEAIFSGKITIKGSCEGKWSILEISDNGGGIPKNVIEKVFNDYFTTKEDKGTGIGLSMSKMIIEDQLQGTITVHNNEDGATFTMKFPTSDLTEKNDV